MFQKPQVDAIIQVNLHISMCIVANIAGSLRQNACRNVSIHQDGNDQCKRVASFWTQIDCILTSQKMTAKAAGFRKPNFFFFCRFCHIFCFLSSGRLTNDPELRAPLKPLAAILLCCLMGFKGALDRAPVMPRDASLSSGCKQQIFHAEQKMDPKACQTAWDFSVVYDAKKLRLFSVFFYNGKK